MTTVKENKDFVEALMPLYPLDDAIDWISNNLEPEDVFSMDKLTEWAEVWADNEGLVKET